MYEDRTPQAIKEEIFAALTSDLQTREGSFADDMAGPLAVQLFKMYLALNQVFRILFVGEDSGAYLDLTANELGIDPRKEGAKAVARLRVEGEAGVCIAAGKRFLTESGLGFLSDTDVFLDENGAGDVGVTAEEAGAAYNVPEGEIRLQAENQYGVRSVTNQQAAQGGADAESDAALFGRIDAHRKEPVTSGNVYHFKKWALETQGVGAARVFPVWAGPGTVKVLIAGENRLPVDDLIVERCRAYIETVRPIGADVTVASAKSVAIAVAARVKLRDGADPQAIAEAFLARLAEYLAAIAFRRYVVRQNRIGALLIELDGVIDYDVLTLNGTDGNIQLTEEEVPVTGEAALEWI